MGKLRIKILNQGGNPPLKPIYEKGNIKLNFSIDHRINYYRITSRSKLFITMAQQTAVEWLVNELLFIQSLKEGEITESNKGILTTSTIEQAKQMEKEQIIQAASLVLWNNSSNSIEEAEKYYNETYGK